MTKSDRHAGSTTPTIPTALGADLKDSARLELALLMLLWTKDFPSTSPRPKVTVAGLVARVEALGVTASAAAVLKALCALKGRGLASTAPSVVVEVNTEVFEVWLTALGVLEMEGRVVPPRGGTPRSSLPAGPRQQPPATPPAAAPPTLPSPPQAPKPPANSPATPPTREFSGSKCAKHADSCRICQRALFCPECAKRSPNAAGEICRGCSLSPATTGRRAPSTAPQLTHRPSDAPVADVPTTGRGAPSRTPRPPSAPALLVADALPFLRRLDRHQLLAFARVVGVPFDAVPTVTPEAVKSREKFSVEAACIVIQNFASEPFATLFPFLVYRSGPAPYELIGGRIATALRRARHEFTWETVKALTVEELQRLRSTNDRALLEFVAHCALIALRTPLSAKLAEAPIGSATRVESERTKPSKTSTRAEVPVAARPTTVDATPPERTLGAAPPERVASTPEAAPPSLPEIPAAGRAGWITERRRALGLDTEKFAAAIGVPESAVSQWEWARLPPTESQWLAARALLARSLHTSAAAENSTGGWTPAPLALVPELGHSSEVLPGLPASPLGDAEARFRERPSAIQAAMPTARGAGGADSTVTSQDAENASSPGSSVARSAPLTRPRPLPRKRPSAAVVGRLPSAEDAIARVERAPSRRDPPDDLSALHDLLCGTFRDLARRSQPAIFLLEHSLAPDAVERTTTLVRTALASRGLDLAYWRDRHLPLLVVTAELGYEYQGPGRDYWDRLAEEVSFQFFYEERLALTGLFEMAARDVGLARPPNSRWAQTYRHIAWPITHAVLPRDLHAPLAKALADLMVASARDLELLVETIRRDAGRFGGARFVSWTNDSAASGLIRECLGDRGASGLEPALVQRILSDLQADPDAAENVRAAAQRGARPRRSGRSGASGAPGPRRVATLQLALVGESLELRVALPPFPHDLMEEARTLTRTSRYALPLWGISRPVRLDRLVGATSVTVIFDRFPSAGAPLLPADLGDEVSEELRSVLGSIDVDVGLPLLFEPPPAQGGVAVQLRGRAVREDHTYWVLTREPPADAPGFTPLGRIGDAICTSVDTTRASARGWFEALGFDTKVRLRARWVGDPPLTPGLPLFGVDDFVALEVRDAPPNSLVSTRAGQAQVSVGERSLVRVTDAALGPDFVKLIGAGASTGFDLQFAGPAAERPVVWAELDSARSVRALLRGVLALRFHGAYPLEDVPVLLAVQVGERRLAHVEAIIPAIPGSLGAGAELWSELLDERVVGHLTQSAAATLSVTIGHLWSGSWRLEDETYWWEPREGQWTPICERGALATACVVESAPVAPPEPGAGPPDRVTVLVPQDSECAPFAGRCFGPRQFSLYLDDPTAPRLVRGRRGLQDDVGLEELARSYLIWSLAVPENPVVAVRQRQVAQLIERWMVTLTCGEQWLRWERSAVDFNERQSVWSALVEVCLEQTRAGRQLGFDGLVTLTADEEEAIRPLIEARLRAAIPTLAEDVADPAGAMSVSLVEGLNRAFLGAYADLAAASQDAARAEELRTVDFWDGAPEWESGLRGLRDRRSLRTLAERLWPLGGGEELADVDFAGLDVFATADVLAEWATRHRGVFLGAPWTDDEVCAAVALWTEPEHALSCWSVALERLAIDRGMARAVRYVALRYALANGAAQR